MQIWWISAAAVGLLLAAAALVLLRLSQRTNNQLGHRVADLTVQVTALHQALDEQRAASRELAHRATHDPLTGLPNRALLVERLESTLPEAALLLVDLDDFGETNEAFGSEAGDEILVEAAKRIRGAVRHLDVVARLGRDEFAVVIPQASPERTRLSAIRVIDALRPAYELEDRRVRVTASIGMLSAGTATTPAEALRDADLALSAARSSGNERLAEFQPELRDERIKRARVVAGLRHAIEHDELTLHYQPIVDLETQAPLGVEALARWSPGGEPIPPSYFIPVAEQTGLVVPLGARILRDACETGRRWYEEYGTNIGVNISGRQLLEPDFADYVLAVLGDTGLPGEALILEITETVLVAASGPEGQIIVPRLERLRSHGIQIAIDDFGTGYSSLSYLHRLPIDILKIDMEFVRALDDQQPRPSSGIRNLPLIGNPLRFGGIGRKTSQSQQPNRSADFAQAILRMGLSLHLSVVAEGVETESQAAALRAMGCPMAQGFLFAHPEDAETTSAFLAEHLSRVSA